MMKHIKVKFVDVGRDFVPEENLCYRILAKHYEVELSDSPDYVISKGVGYGALRYEDSIRIAYVGENIVPDFNHYDYAIGFDRISFGDRYLRMPLYAFYREYQKLENRVAPDAKELLNRDFCSFVVSNSALADPLRTSFFHKLSKYRKVDSGGRYLNNVGGPVPDKLEFCRKYKFNIAFENSVSPGYVTEKVMQPLTWFSMPIYYGDPFVEDEFSAQSMVRVRDADDVDRAIEEIIRLDKNDDEYLARVTAPCLARPYGSYEAALEKFLTGIVDRPVEEVRRLNRYGCQVGRRARQLKLEEMARKLHAPVLWLRKLLG